jgi:hypothetical protein
MPLYWTIDSRAQLVTAVAEGEVSLDEAMAFLRAVDGADAVSYRKLFDGRAGTSSMSEQELLVISAEVRAHHGRGKVGALAIVAGHDQTARFGRLLGALAMADRPMKLFDNLSRARSWLEEQGS